MAYEIVILFLGIITGGFSITPILEYSSSFPVHANTPFQLKLSAKNTYHFFSMIRVEIFDDGQQISRVIVHPGISDHIEDKVANLYFRLDNWFKDSSRRLIIDLRLQEAANGKWLCVSFQEPKTMDEKKAALQLSCKTHSLFFKQIHLTVDPTLDLSISTKDGRTDGVHHNDVAIIKCVSHKGVPPQPPTLSHSSSILVKSNKFEKDSNTIMRYFLASLSDHGKIITCSAGRTSASITVHVFHNPTDVYLNPSFSTYIPNGTSVQCVSSNGYPPPTVTWIFITGPTDASKYYRISPSHNLTMLPDTPIESNWVFNCSSINSIATSYDAGVTKTFRFTVYPVNHATTIIVSVFVCLAVLLVVAIVICCNKKKIHSGLMKIVHSRSGTNKDTGDDALNNFTSSYFTYPTVADSTPDPAIEPETKKPTRKSRRPKAKRDSDIYEEDNIV